MSDASEESMNHGTREDKEEDRVDRYRTEHLVAACCHMRMGERVAVRALDAAANNFVFVIDARKYQPYTFIHNTAFLHIGKRCRVPRR